MYQYPHTIENKHGEKLIFVNVIKEPDGDKVITRGFAKPGAGPVTHVHWKQDESLTVVKGKMATQVPGEEPKFYGPGETATFIRGTWHRFWNAGEDELEIEGWIKPVNNVVYFLTELYKAIDNGKEDRPEPKAATFLTMRYKSEFATNAIPAFVRKIIMPMQYFIGNLTGSFKNFKDAPPPVNS